MAKVTIGSHQREFIEVLVSGWAMPNAADHPSRNGLAVLITVHVGAWHAIYSAELDAGDFAAFRRQLECLYRTHQGEARFQPRQPWLNLTLTMDPLENATVKAWVRDELSDTGSRLECTLAHIPQSDILPLLAQLRDVEHEFPPRGSLDD